MTFDHLHALFTGISPVSVHDEGDVLRDRARFENTEEDTSDTVDGIVPKPECVSQQRHYGEGGSVLMDASLLQDIKRLGFVRIINLNYCKPIKCKFAYNGTKRGFETSLICPICDGEFSMECTVNIYFLLENRCFDVGSLDALPLPNVQLRAID